MNNNNFQFNIDDNTYQIRFSYPDKNLNDERRLTVCSLYIKIVNPEDYDDYLWNLVSKETARCNFHVYYSRGAGHKIFIGDKFDKYTGKKVALTKLLANNFSNKEIRKQIWNQFFDLYGISIRLNRNIILTALSKI